MEPRVPRNKSIKTALIETNLKNSLRYSKHYKEFHKYTVDQTTEVMERILKAMITPWESIPDVDTTPQNILFVANNAAWNSMERELTDDMYKKTIDDLDKFVEWHKTINEKGRQLYDDIIALWSSQHNN